MQRKISILIILLGVFQLSYGQQELPQKKNPFSFEAAYVGETYGNAGGLKTGGGYMGMGNLKIGFDTEKARWWKGGSFFINGASIHGKSLSENFAGDLQVASNIDAGAHTVYLHELWFKQEFKKFSFTIGLQDLNADFLASENAGEFINSSFGIPPVVSCNIPVPIFPLTGLGVSAQWTINDKFVWQAALFDGNQTSFENNPHNVHWKFYKDDGVFIATEFHSKVAIKEKEGTYKLGAYYHSGVSEFDEETRMTNDIFKNNYGFYFIADQTIFERGTRKIGLFTQVAAAPKSKNEHAYYLGFGGNYYGIFSKEGKDVLGLAVACLDLHRTSHNHETTLELFYKWQFNDNFAVQPDIQYIINPSGTGVKLANALVGILRLHINF